MFIEITLSQIKPEDNRKITINISNIASFWKPEENVTKLPRFYNCNIKLYRSIGFTYGDTILVMETYEEIQQMIYEVLTKYKQ